MGNVLFHHSTALGYRVIDVDKVEFSRGFRTITSPYGPLSLKEGQYGEEKKVALEYEEIRKLSQVHDLSFYKLRRILEGKAFDDFSSLKE